MVTKGDNKLLSVVTTGDNKLHGTISLTAASKQILIIKTAKLDYSLMAPKTSTIGAFTDVSHRCVRRAIFPKFSHSVQTLCGELKSPFLSL